MRVIINFILIVVVATSCNKMKLTKETHVGANTFSCKINGEIFIPADIVTVAVDLEGLVANYIEDEGYLQLSAREPKRKDDDERSRSINIDASDLHLGEQLFGDSLMGQVSVNGIDLSEWYVGNTPGEGSLTITRLDTVENIISGTFSFKGQPRFNSDKTVSVTDGRFDIRYVEL